MYFQIQIFGATHNPEGPHMSM